MRGTQFASVDGMTKCECSDPRCPVKHSNNRKNVCQQTATTIVRRIDMEDGETCFAMCDGCTSDALDSGVFDVVDDDTNHDAATATGMYDHDDVN